MTRSPLHLGYIYRANGAHPAGWRYPGAEHARAFDPDYVTGLAKIVEEAKFDFFLFGDRLATGTDGQDAGSSDVAGTEPFTTAAYLATRTSKIGLVASASSAYYEPFNLARLTASLDHITRGRAAWNIVTGGDPRAATNYSVPEHGDVNFRYDRAEEFVQLVKALWDSWEDDAFIRNKETGEFVNGSKIHPVDHNGKSFRVKGPLNVARPPQGHPVVLHGGSSARSRQFAARAADATIADAATIAEAVEHVVDVRRRAAELGRSPDEVLFLRPLTPIVGTTLAEAQAVHDELSSLAPLDENARFGGQVVVGGPAEVADYIERWLETGAAQGFNIHSAFLPGQLDAFVNLVVPELRRRGLFRSEYEGSTLREHLGLTRPESQFASNGHVAPSKQAKVS